jgi:hypothetical protein
VVTDFFFINYFLGGLGGRTISNFWIVPHRCSLDEVLLIPKKKEKRGTLTRKFSFFTNCLLSFTVSLKISSEFCFYAALITFLLLAAWNVPQVTVSLC